MIILPENRKESYLISPPKLPGTYMSGGLNKNSKYRFLFSLLLLITEGLEMDPENLNFFKFPGNYDNQSGVGTTQKDIESIPQDIWHIIKTQLMLAAL